METIAFLVVLGTLCWLVTARINYLWYNRQFADGPAGQDRDLLVTLGPIGTVMLSLTAGLSAYTKMCNHYGKKFKSVSNIVLIFGTVVIPWAGAGVANHIWYNRLFPDSEHMDMPRDFLSTLGPIGSFMLLLCYGLDRILKFASTAEA